MRAHELGDEVRRQLQLYDDDVRGGIEEATSKIAKEGRKKIKSIGGYKDRSGEYRKGFYLRDHSTRRRPAYTLANKKYQLTHLLEHGHATKDGGRTGASPHWDPVAEYMAKAYLDEVTSVLEGRHDGK